MLVVESPGMLTTVQDLGRAGYGPMGVSASGAADPVALQLANVLVGNERGAAALELTLTGGRYHFPQGGVIALAGSDFAAKWGGHFLEMWIRLLHSSGRHSDFWRDARRGALLPGDRGGIHVASFLGSASTHLVSGLGGLSGRPLQKGDILQLGESHKILRRRRIAARIIEALAPHKTLRATVGPQFDEFPAEAQKTIFSAGYTVTEESDRLGLRLHGPLLPAESFHGMITEGVTLGAVQVTPSGQAIILFVEQQTTGGYPKIVNVIGADLSSLGQLRPREVLHFEQVTFQKARELWIEQQTLLSDEGRLFA